MGTQKGSGIGCCDKHATNYDINATTCCKDCCIYSGGGSGTEHSPQPKPLITQAKNKPNDGGNWQQYTIKWGQSGSCQVNAPDGSGGRIKETWPTAINPGKVWAKPNPDFPDLFLIALQGNGRGQCNIMSGKKFFPDGRSRFEEIADRAADGTSGSIDTQQRMAGFDFGKYAPYLIAGVIIIGFLWYKGYLKKLMPKR